MTSKSIFNIPFSPVHYVTNMEYPHKSAKCSWTNKLTTHYQTLRPRPQVFGNKLPTDWIPQCVVIDAMFIIHTKCLRSTKTIEDYAKLLFNRFIKGYLSCGVTEIHVVFDKPSSTYFNPKIYEQKRCDNSTTSSGLHQHISFEQSKALSNVTWQCISECRACKECLIKGIGLIFYQMGHLWITEQQTLVLPCCFDDDIAWVIRNGVASVPQPEPQYHPNAKEADQLVWRHAVMCPSSTVLIFSPDTDIFVIGLGILSGYSKQFVVQNNLPHSGVQKYINVNNLPSALQNDSDLASLATETIPGVMVGLFVATGSDYTSYFKNIGKATFLNLFFQYSRFISGNGMEGH